MLWSTVLHEREDSVFGCVCVFEREGDASVFMWVYSRIEREREDEGVEGQLYYLCVYFLVLRR